MLWQKSCSPAAAAKGGPCSAPQSCPGQRLQPRRAPCAAGSSPCCSAQQPRNWGERGPNPRSSWQPPASAPAFTFCLHRAHGAGFLCLHAPLTTAPLRCHPPHVLPGHPGTQCGTRAGSPPCALRGGVLGGPASPPSTWLQDPALTGAAAAPCCAAEGLVLGPVPRQCRTRSGSEQGSEEKPLVG